MLGAPGVDLRAAQEAERKHLEVASVVLTRDLHGAACLSDLFLDTAGVTRPLDGHPPVTGAALDVLQCPLGAREPAAGRRDAARDEVLMRHPHRHPRGVVAAAGADVLLERPLAHRDAARNVAEEPQRLPEAIARFG